MRHLAAGLFALLFAAGGALANYPVPRETNQVFYVQRSLNANTIIYAARLDPAGRLDRDAPLEVYWRRYNDEGERKELSGLERNFAFGVRVRSVTGIPGQFMVSVVSYPRRSAVLKLVDGVPRLEMEVGGQPSLLDHAYLVVDESGTLPSVIRVDLYGRVLATGAPVKESFTP